MTRTLCQQHPRISENPFFCMPGYCPVFLLHTLSANCTNIPRLNPAKSKKPELYAFRGPGLYFIFPQILPSSAALYIH